MTWGRLKGVERIGSMLVGLALIAMAAVGGLESDRIRALLAVAGLGLVAVGFAGL